MVILEMIAPIVFAISYQSIVGIILYLHNLSFASDGDRLSIVCLRALLPNHRHFFHSRKYFGFSALDFHPMSTCNACLGTDLGCVCGVIH